MQDDGKLRGKCVRNMLGNGLMTSLMSHNSLSIPAFVLTLTVVLPSNFVFFIFVSLIYLNMKNQQQQNWA